MVYGDRSGLARKPVVGDSDGICPVELRSDQKPSPRHWKDHAGAVVHDILDVAVATTAGVVAVFIFFPIYLVAGPARRVLRRAIVQCQPKRFLPKKYSLCSKSAH